MIKSLLYYIALLLFVIYNCNTPLNYVKSLIPPSVGKYLLGFPAFIVVTTILVVYPILTGKELLTFDTDSTMTNIFRPDTADSVNRATVVIDDSGEIVLEKSTDVNKNFTDLITSLRADLNAINSKVNNNTNILKTQLEALVDNTKSNIDSLNGHFAGAADATSAITPAPLPTNHGITCGSGSEAQNRKSTRMCKRKKQGDSWKNEITTWWNPASCGDDTEGVALLTGDKNNANSGHYQCIRSHGLKFISAEKRGSATYTNATVDFAGLQTS